MIDRIPTGSSAFVALEPNASVTYSRRSLAARRAPDFHVDGVTPLRGMKGNGPKSTVSRRRSTLFQKGTRRMNGQLGRALLILGTRGIPAAHMAGSKPLRRRLAHYSSSARGWDVTVYCQKEVCDMSAQRYETDTWAGIRRVHVAVVGDTPARDNGVRLALRAACLEARRGVCLVLGYNTAVFTDAVCGSHKRPDADQYGRHRVAATQMGAAAACLALRERMVRALRLSAPSRRRSSKDCRTHRGPQWPNRCDHHSLWRRPGKSRHRRAPVEALGLEPGRYFVSDRPHRTR